MDKCNPGAFFKLQHYAMREAFHQLNALAEAELDGGDSRVNEQRMATFAAVLHGLTVTFREHAAHEEHIIYFLIRQWPPTFLTRLDAQHVEHGGLLPNLLRDYMDKVAPVIGSKHAHDTALQALMVDVAVARREIVEHMNEEEQHVIVRKFLNTQQAVQMLRAAWAYTAPHAWAVILPFCVRTQFHHMRRVRFLQALVWALPGTRTTDWEVGVRRSGSADVGSH